MPTASGCNKDRRIQTSKMFGTHLCSFLLLLESDSSLTLSATGKVMPQTTAATVSGPNQRQTSEQTFATSLTIEVALNILFLCSACLGKPSSAILWAATLWRNAFSSNSSYSRACVCTMQVTLLCSLQEWDPEALFHPFYRTVNSTELYSIGIKIVAECWDVCRKWSLF